MKFEYFNANFQTPIEDCKKQYLKLAQKYHPDHGGSDEAMKKINDEWMWLKRNNSHIHRDMNGGIYSDETQDSPDEVTEKFASVINALIRLDGVAVEICGSFIWLSGDTYRWKDALRALGFKWSRRKRMWYMAPNKKRHYSHDWSMERIRAHHGSYVVVKPVHKDERNLLPA